ncbi:formylglycine-generating enzyme family protein [Tabrizicola sp.]|uniref:formylglycine-generating enzyme family protein n=1 Tax=Tabrizicola sp. TaxID=2005166 RepID=UPI002616B125|nr:formylglycine-generating enzyme family protein [Tabrizicola sp.]MDM7932769.1 formylglycine-generating enzyme family protein [Tabrizicola sp.]
MIRKTDPHPEAGAGGCGCLPATPGAKGQGAVSLPHAAASETLRSEVMAGMRQIPGGFLEMGAARSRYAVDLDSPRRRVRLDRFELSETTVTNRLFARFVTESGYKTTAEREGWSFVFAVFLADPAAHPRHAPHTPWWRQVFGADWAHPEGSGSTIEGRMDHPVVHVSWHDAAAFARFTGTRLPGEAEWEHAARGGLKGMKFPWGNALVPGGEHRHNVWQGDFPHRNTAEDGHAGAAPARSFPPNGYGLFNMTGNVWEWVADWFGPLPAPRLPPLANPTGPETGDRKVMRGGSHLCHASYCERYFVHSRTQNTPDSSTGHIGFRVAMDAPALDGKPSAGFPEASHVSR